MSDQRAKVIKGLNIILVYCHNHYNKADSKGQIELAAMNQAAKDAIDLLKTQKKRIDDLESEKMWDEYPDRMGK